MFVVLMTVLVLDKKNGTTPTRQKTGHVVKCMNEGTGCILQLYLVRGRKI